MPLRELEHIASSGIGALLGAGILAAKQAFQSRSKVDVEKVRAEAKKEVPVVETALRMAERANERAEEDTRRFMNQAKKTFDCQVELAKRDHRIDLLEGRINSLCDEYAEYRLKHANCPGLKSEPPQKPTFLTSNT